MRDIVLRKTFATQYLTEPLYEGDGGYRLCLNYGKDLTGCEITAKVKRSDGTVVTYLGEGDGNYACCRLEAGAFTVVGECEIRLQIISADSVVTAIVAEGIIKEMLGGDDVASDDRYPVLTSLINEVRELKEGNQFEFIVVEQSGVSSTNTFSGKNKRVVFCNAACGDTAFFKFPENPPERVGEQEEAIYHVTIYNEAYQHGCNMFEIPSGEIGSLDIGIFDFIIAYCFSTGLWEVKDYASPKRPVYKSFVDDMANKANAEQVAKDIEAATSNKEDKKNKNKANGYAGLDEENQVPDEHLQNYLKVKTTELRQGNILNLDTLTVGKWGSDGKFLETVTSFFVTDYERVIEGETYSGWQIYGKMSVAETNIYDRDKNYITTVSSVNTNLITIPEGGYYASFSVVTGHAAAERIPYIIRGTVDTGYSEYLNEEVTIYKEYAEKSTFESKITELQQGNILYGKKWTACGDSFTAGPNTGTFEDGLYAGKNKVYPFFIGRRNNMAIVNEAISGSTMTAGDNSANPFSGTRYTAIATDSDYITIMLGINDDNYHKQMPIGTIDDADITTFYGAWNVVLEYLIEHHPFAKIGIIVPNGCTSDYAAAIRAVSRKWGIPYLDIASDYQVPLLHRVNEKTEVCARAKELRAANFAISEADTHPNAACHEYESTFIEAWLRTL